MFVRRAVQQFGKLPRRGRDARRWLLPGLPPTRRPGALVADDPGGITTLAAAGSLLVGLLESFSSFWASAFKEVIVFTLIIPVLLWRSLTSQHHDDDE